MTYEKNNVYLFQCSFISMISTSKTIVAVMKKGHFLKCSRLLKGGGGAFYLKNSEFGVFLSEGVRLLRKNLVHSIIMQKVNEVIIASYMLG